MRHRTLAWIAAGALAALPAFAGHPPGPPPGGPQGGPPEGFLEMRAERLADALDLTTDQRATFERLRGEALAAAEPARERMRAAHDELEALLDAENPVAAEVGAKMIEVHRLRGELRATREKFERDFEATLTDAQKLALKAVRETRPGERMRERAGRGEWGERGGRGPWGGPPAG